MGSTKTGRRDGVPTVIHAIKERLRPVFMRKFREARGVAKAACLAAGMDDEQAETYLEGFDQGWLRGALDSASIKPEDLHPIRREKKMASSETH